MESKNPYMPTMAQIVSVTKETEDTSTFRVKYSYAHDPGQFVEVSLLGIGECPISIASWSPNHMDLCIRKVGSVTGAIHNLRQGDSLFIRGPYGVGYPIQEFIGKNIILIGGGTGVAPLRSVVEYLARKRTDFKNISLFFGFRSPSDMLFKADMAGWRSIFSLNISVDKADSTWNGNVCLVTELLEKAKINKENTIVIICGPPVMLKCVMNTLNKFNFSDEQVYVSFERHMRCGIGKCGHCMVNNKYICRDGPVFRYDEAKKLID